MCYKYRILRLSFPQCRISPQGFPPTDLNKGWAISPSKIVSAIIYPTVLVAEDSTDTRIMLKRAFELKGYRVFEAEDGKQALDMARRHHPSLIVVDLNMPVLDGLETIRSFRKLEGEGDHTPIVAITAYDVYGLSLIHI